MGDSSGRGNPTFVKIDESSGRNPARNITDPIAARSFGFQTWENQATSEYPPTAENRTFSLPVKTPRT
jgi:hypothetical protein